MTITVTAAILEEEGRVLMTRRSPGQTLAGYWEFPGGKLESGETLQQCLERELSEELGIKIDAGEIIGKNVHDYADKTIELIALRAKWLHGSISLSVHDAHEMIPIPDLLEYQIAPADIPIAHLLMEGRND